MIVGDIDTLADDRAGRFHRLREAEVEHLHRAVGPHLDVRGLEIAVDDPLLVRRFERLGDLLRDRQRFVDRNRAARDALRQIVALDQFHHEGVHAAGFLEPVDRGDVRMIQRRERLRLAFEARQAFGVCGERVGQDLDRDLAAQRRVRRPVDLPHAAFADLGGDFVDAEARAGGQGQTGRIIRARWHCDEPTNHQRRRDDLARPAGFLDRWRLFITNCQSRPWRHHRLPGDMWQHR